MGPLTKRQKRARLQLVGSTNGRFRKLPRKEEPSIITSTEIANDAEITVNIEQQDDSETLETMELTKVSETTKVTKETLQASFPIQWNQNNDISSRGKYWGVSRTVKYYRDKQASKKKNGSHEITDFFIKST
ncbi:hypothetical protein INT45_011242 [Circinella minor]|uniref:Uncharacterized protein n=1 Tax=Circinella minor TaxID=1195481 RepID=A0A8H7RT80_9FUNG|nr:hypothetical protein INT45_011242 [Circinella minor]